MRLYIESDMARLEPGSGTLFLDFRPHVDRWLRYSSWHSGMTVSAWGPAGWADEPHDPELSLLHCGGRNEAGNPLCKYLNTIPCEARELAGAFNYRQTTVLRLLRRSNSARDLASDNPALLLVVAHWMDATEQPLEDVVELLRVKRRRILRAVTGVDSNAAVNALRHLRVRYLDNAAVAAIIEGVSSERFRRLVSEDAALTTEALRVAASAPEELAHGLVLDLLREPHPRPALFQAMRLFEDTRRLGFALGIVDHETALSRCRNRSQLRRLHDRWCARYNRGQAPRPSRYGDRRFPRPPIPGTADIVPIESASALREEGDRMRHCVGSYVLEVLEGRSFVYAVLAPERATLEVAFAKDGPCIRQLRLAHNRSPSAKTRMAVQKWLDEWRATVRSGGKVIPLSRREH